MIVLLAADTQEVSRLYVGDGARSHTSDRMWTATWSPCVAAGVVMIHESNPDKSQVGYTRRPLSWQ